MYLYGKYLEKHEKIFHNLKESFHYIKLAADHGHKKAMKVQTFQGIAYIYTLI